MHALRLRLRRPQDALRAPLAVTHVVGESERAALIGLSDLTSALLAFVMRGAEWRQVFGRCRCNDLGESRGMPAKAVAPPTDTTGVPANPQARCGVSVQMMPALA